MSVHTWGRDIPPPLSKVAVKLQCYSRASPKPEEVVQCGALSDKARGPSSLLASSWGAPQGGSPARIAFAWDLKASPPADELRGGLERALVRPSSGVRTPSGRAFGGEASSSGEQRLGPSCCAGRPPSELLASCGPSCPPVPPTCCASLPGVQWGALAQANWRQPQWDQRSEGGSERSRPQVVVAAALRARGRGPVGEAWRGRTRVGRGRCRSTGAAGERAPLALGCLGGDWIRAAALALRGSGLGMSGPARRGAPPPMASRPLPPLLQLGCGPGSQQPKALEAQTRRDSTGP